MKAIGIGDGVRLRNGGPAMTVEGLAGEDATCIWFAEGVLQRATFAVSLLERAPHIPLAKGFGKAKVTGKTK